MSVANYQLYFKQPAESISVGYISMGVPIILILIKADMPIK